jgi:hypothetical protein
MCTCSLCRCQVAVHQECYGAKNVQDFTSWVCRVCETPEVERECCLCPVKGMSSTFNIFFGLTIFAVLLHYIRFVWKVVTFESSKIILQWEIGNFSFLSWLAWLYHVLTDLCMQSLYPIFYIVMKNSLICLMQICFGVSWRAYLKLICTYVMI